MSTKQDIPALLASNDGYASLDASTQERLNLMVGSVEEVVGVEHLMRKEKQEMCETRETDHICGV